MSYMYIGLQTYPIMTPNVPVSSGGVSAGVILKHINGLRENNLVIVLLWSFKDKI